MSPTKRHRYLGSWTLPSGNSADVYLTPAGLQCRWDRPPSPSWPTSDVEHWRAVNLPRDRPCESPPSPAAGARSQRVKAAEPAPSLALDPATVADALGRDAGDPHAVGCLRFDVLAAIRRLEQEIESGEITPGVRLVRGRPLADWLDLDELTRLLRAREQWTREATGVTSMADATPITMRTRVPCWRLHENSELADPERAAAAIGEPTATTLRLGFAVERVPGHASYPNCGGLFHEEGGA